MNKGTSLDPWAVPLGRTGLLRDDVQKRHGSFVPDQNPCVLSVARWKALQPGRSRVQARAAFLLEQVRLASILIGPHWRLAGEHLPRAAQWKIPRPDPADENAVAQLARLGVEPKDAGTVRDAVAAWEEYSSPLRPPLTLGEFTPGSEDGRDFWGSTGGGQGVFIASGWIENHSIRDYAKVLRMGFGGLRREIERRLAAADITAPDYPQKENFWRAALWLCEAGCLLGKRYADLAREQSAQAADESERERLRTMAETCARVPAEGARTFFEAVQALWFAHILTCGEDGINANGIGRLDQILYPYYAADVKAGRLTRAGALEIMEELACKLYQDYDVQAITLGGVDREGRDAVNDLSYIILEATRNVGFVRDVSVRLHRGSPAEFIQLAAELIARGGGIPFIFNDDCFVKALAERGISLEDARDYAPIGCVELTIPGRANPHAVSGWLNSTKCLELALFDGQDPRSGAQVGPRTGRLDEMGGFEAFWEAYARQVEFFTARMVYHCNRGELRQREFGPLPYWSLLTDDCVARGRDITDGGAVYNYHSIAFAGTANTADALMALAKLVFGSGEVAPVELLEALKAGFEGHEALRRKLLHHAPKYGNDEPEVDALARRVDEHIIALLDGMRSPLDGRYVAHLFSWKVNLHFGKCVGATPDGRLPGEPLAYSLSAHQGRDERGITAMLNSLARLPHDRAAGASAAILDLDPALLAGAGGAARLAALIRGAIQMGIGQLQWNVTTAERLRQAQQDPERYGNIPVRVAGYSQMFRLIEKELQEHIIARTKHRR